MILLLLLQQKTEDLSNTGKTTSDYINDNPTPKIINDNPTPKRRRTFHCDDCEKGNFFQAKTSKSSRIYA